MVSADKQRGTYCVWKTRRYKTQDHTFSSDSYMNRNRTDLGCCLAFKSRKFVVAPR